MQYKDVRGHIQLFFIATLGRTNSTINVNKYNINYSMRWRRLNEW